MIQRIQSLWLLLAACCMALCLMVPVAKYHFDNMPAEGQRVEARLDLFAQGDATMLPQMDQPVSQYSQRLTGMETWPLVTIVLSFSNGIFSIPSTTECAVDIVRR